MKYSLIPLIILFSSCYVVKPEPPKGIYPKTPIEFKSSQSFDKSWERLVDLFAQKNLTIRLIDKSSGLLVSQKSLLIATIEDNKGMPVNTLAQIVVPTVTVNRRREPISGSDAGPYANAKQIAEKANPIYGDWNVRIKPDGTGSIININNVYFDYYNTNAKMYVPTSINVYKSTGNFEQDIANLIK